MKKVLAVFGLLFIASTTFAQAQATITYPRAIKRDVVISLADGQIAFKSKMDQALKIQSQLSAIANTKSETFSKRELITINKKSGQMIDEELIVNQFEGCQKFDRGCLNILELSNPKIAWQDINYEGSIDVPAKSFVLAFHICAQNAEHESAIMQIFKGNSSLHILSRVSAIYSEGTELWKEDLSCVP